MDPNKKRYNKLVNAYKNAYPDIKSSLKLQKTQTLWNVVKSDEKKYLIGKNLVGKKFSRQKNLVGKNFGHFEKFGHFLPGVTFDPIVFRVLIRQKN